MSESSSSKEDVRMRDPDAGEPDSSPKLDNGSSKSSSSKKDGKKERSGRKRRRSQSRSRRDRSHSSRRSRKRRERSRSRSRSRDSKRRGRRDSRRRSSRRYSSKSPSRRRYRSNSRGRRRSRSRSRSRSRGRSRSRSRPRAFDKSAVLQAVIGGRLPLTQGNAAQNYQSHPVHPHQLLQQQQLHQPSNLPHPAPTDDASMQATRPSRRLYIGNLPMSMQPAVSEPALLEFFRAAVQSVGVKTPDPLLSVWLSSERTFCFLEFRSVQDCSACLNLLQGIQLGGRVLRVGRPADFSAPPPGLENFIAGHPPGTFPPPSLTVTSNSGAAAGVAGLGALAGAGLLPSSPPGVSATVAPDPAGNPALSNLLALEEPASSNPSRVIVLLNLLVCPEIDSSNPSTHLSLLPNELTSDPEACLDLLMDVREQCEALLSQKASGSTESTDSQEKNESAMADDADSATASAGALQVKIPLPPNSTAIHTPEADEGPVLQSWEHANALGRVFVRFETPEQANSVRSGLQGLKYFGRTVQIGFYDPEGLERGEYHLPLLS